MRLVEFVSARLRELRLRHELTQEEVAGLLGADVKWYQRIEWCTKDLRASTIDRLAAIFEVTAAEFLSAELPTTRLHGTKPTQSRKPTAAAKRKEVRP